MVGIVWLAVALFPALMLAPGGWGWWMGHLLEFLGVALVGIPLALDARRGAPVASHCRRPAGRALVAEAEAFLGARSAPCCTASTATTARPRSTRAASPPGRWRSASRWGCVAAACASSRSPGILHDIGKLSVPHAILAKPGGLPTPRWTSSAAPGWGDELLPELGYP